VKKRRGKMRCPHYGFSWIIRAGGPFPVDKKRELICFEKNPLLRGGQLAPEERIPV
jgi:hypothetical protein